MPNMSAYKFWPNQWLYLAAFVASMDIMMTVRKFYFINVICSGAFSIIFADICVKIYEVFVYKRKFIEDAEKKAVLVTGCDTGFGILYSQKLANMGLLVYSAVLDPNGEGAKILETQKNVVVLRLDVTDQSSIDQALDFVKADLKKRGDRTFWSLVNNAGLVECCDVEFASLDHYQRVMEVNTLGVVRMCKSFLPLLRAAGGGRIVNIGSQSSRLTIPCMTAYGMSISAISSFSDGLRRELKPWNISVHTIDPFYSWTASIEDKIKNVRSTYLKLWQAGPAEVKHAYGEEYREDLICGLMSLPRKYNKSGEELNEVVGDLAHAVAGVDPNVQYVPATKLKIVSKFLSFLPQELTDYFITPKMKVLPAGVKDAQMSDRKRS